jgi:hypothetical protein
MPGDHDYLFLRQRSEQYFTSFQFRFHFFLQVKGSPHEAQIFAGNSGFLIKASPGEAIS